MQLHKAIFQGGIMDAFELLKNDHKKVSALFKEIESACRKKEAHALQPRAAQPGDWAVTSFVSRAVAFW
jgi:hypothetical protein